jgi:hypothetical protein
MKWRVKDGNMLSNLIFTLSLWYRSFQNNKESGPATISTLWSLFVFFEGSNFLGFSSPFDEQAIKKRIDSTNEK